MLHQVPAEWEVVDAYAVEPVRVYVEDDGATIVRLAPHEIVGAYTFDMAPPAPPRPLHRKRHSHDGSTASASKPTTDEQRLAPSTSRRASHPTTRPQLQEHHSAPPSLPIQRTESPASLTASSAVSAASAESYSSHSSPASSHPKLTRLGTAFSFFRTHGHHSRHRSERRRSSSPAASSEGSLSGSGSGSGSSDGDSEATHRRHLLGRRRNSGKSAKEESRGLCDAEYKKPAATATAAPVAGNPAYRKADLKRALMFARGELMKQVEASGKNALVLEGWSITVLRQALRYRIRIEYTGRPAIISYSEQLRVESAHRAPPFLEVIDEH